MKGTKVYVTIVTVIVSVSSLRHVTCGKCQLETKVSVSSIVSIMLLFYVLLAMEAGLKL